MSLTVILVFAFIFVSIFTFSIRLFFLQKKLENRKGSTYWFENVDEIL